MKFIVTCIMLQLLYVFLGTCYLEAIITDYGENASHVSMYWAWDKSTDFTWCLLFWAIYNPTVLFERYYRQWLRNLLGICSILLFVRTSCGYYADTMHDADIYVYMQAVNIFMLSLWLIYETSRYMNLSRE